MKNALDKQDLPDPDDLISNPEEMILKPETTMPVTELNDLQIRLIGIPFFGLAIPNLTGLIHNELYTLTQLVPAYLYFIFIAFAIWQGNRFILFRLREKYSWLNNPLQKIATLVVSNVLYTLPLSFTLMWLWFRFSSEPAVNWNAMTSASLMCVICVIFITHVYELFFLAKQWENNKAQNEKLQVTLNRYLVINQQVAPPAETGTITPVQKILARSGESYFPLRPSAIAYFISKEKITFITDRSGSTYHCDESLSELEKTLDPNQFSRVNRQVIVHADAIRSFRPHIKGRIKLELEPPCKTEVIVSQESAPQFRQWIMEGVRQGKNLVRSRAISLPA